MPALPLNAAEPLTAVLGVMLCPADEDTAARDCWEALTLARVVGQFRAQGGSVDDGLLDWILAHCGPFSVNQKDLAERWAGGTMTGELVCVLQWLTANRPELASWKRAVEWLEAMDQKGFTRSAIYRNKKRFMRVAHLWGAYCIKRRKISDLQAFLGLSEQIRAWGQIWRRDDEKAQPLFANDMWFPPEDWTHPDPDWPERIKFPYYDLPSLGDRTPRWLLTR
jgi:hypothetical protein